MTFDELRQGFNFLADPTAGEVRLAATETVATAIIAPLVDRLSQRYPRMTFHVVTGGFEALCRDLSERKYDFVVSQSGLILAARITLPHFSVSSASSLPKSAGEFGTGVPCGQIFSPALDLPGYFLTPRCINERYLLPDLPARNRTARPDRQRRKLRLSAGR